MDRSKKVKTGRNEGPVKACQVKSSQDNSTQDPYSVQYKSSQDWSGKVNSIQGNSGKVV